MASYYPEELINEIIMANDLVDVIAGYVQLKKAGRSYKGLCPFHNEKTPSFTVSQEKQLYHCFGCGEGGSVIQFIEKIENLDFVETIQFLAQRAGIQLPEGNEKADDSVFYAKKKKMLEMYRHTARFYVDILYGEAGKPGRDYLVQRGLDVKTAKHFGLGYAPDKFDECVRFLKGKGYDEALIEEAGLARQGKNGKYYDFFRGRLMVPIIDIRGNVIAFGGRILDDGQPKYLNSPDTPIFNKNKTLFAFNFAKRYCSEQIIVAEGYMDVIALHRAGFQNAVATLGTAITSNHVGMLARYTKEVVLCYDSDDAGRKATERALELLQRVNIRTKVLHVTDAKDPDEFIKKKGAQGFARLLGKSENSMMYQVGELKKQYDLGNLEEKIEFLNELAKLFAKISNPIEREILVREAAAESGVSEDAIFAQIRENQYNIEKNRNNEIERAKNRQLVQNRVQHKDIQTELYEGMLANLICTDKQVYLAVRERAETDFFKSPAARSFMQKVYQQWDSGQVPDMPLILGQMEAEQAREISVAASRELPYADNVKAAEDILQTIEGRRKNAQAAQIGSAEELDNLLKSLKK
ncbi:MAG: DNA primase [Clostridia bacterium]|nr:DNA primase [Clostridia bacterium]